MKIFEKITTRFLINSKNIMLVLFLSILLSSTYYSIGKIEGVNHILLSSFRGYEAGSLWIPRWMLFATTNLLSAYLIGIFFDNIKNNKVIPYIIRFGNKKKWINEIESTVLKGTIVFSVIYILVAFIMGIMVSKDININLCMIIEFFLISFMWFIEMFVISEFFITMCLVTNSSIISFVILFVGYFSVNIPFSKIYMNPFGISSYLRINAFTDGVISWVIAEMLLMLIIFIASKFILYKIGKEEYLNRRKI